MLLLLVWRQSACMTTSTAVRPFGKYLRIHYRYVHRGTNDRLGLYSLARGHLYRSCGLPDHGSATGRGTLSTVHVQRTHCASGFCVWLVKKETFKGAITATCGIEHYSGKGLVSSVGIGCCTKGGDSTHLSHPDTVALKKRARLGLRRASNRCGWMALRASTRYNYCKHVCVFDKITHF